MSRLSKDLTIVNELGLHARSAARIAKIAQTARAQVWIEKDGETVDATSVIDMLTLAGAKGTQLTLTIEDPDDFAILNDIARLIENGFGE